MIPPACPVLAGGNQSLRQMRRQGMIGGLVEERRFLGRRF
jgi:hypothetical protein